MYVESSSKGESRYHEHRKSLILHTLKCIHAPFTERISNILKEKCTAAPPFLGRELLSNGQKGSWFRQQYEEKREFFSIQNLRLLGDALPSRLLAGGRPPASGAYMLAMYNRHISKDFLTVTSLF